MSVWKLNIKTAARPGYDPWQFCKDRGIIGVGWPVYTVRDSLTKTQYLKAARTRYAKGKSRMPVALGAIVDRMKVDDLVWTRDAQNRYYLCRITGEWEYRMGEAYDNHDIHNARTCEWLEVGVVDNVPWAIVRQFSRGTLAGMGRQAERMLTFSMLKYNQVSGTDYYQEVKFANDGLFSLIGPDDCEDIVALYLQEKLGYRLLPSTCKPTTKHYEFVLLRPDGNRAVAQVKSGLIDLHGDHYADLEEIQEVDNERGGSPTQVYLFTTQGVCDTGGHENVTCLSVDQLKQFILTHPYLQSRKVQTWLSYIQ